MKRHPRSFWAGLVDELRAGASAAEVARRHRVREKTLIWWRSKLGGRTSDSPRLLPVVQGSVPVAVRHVEVAVGDVVLRFVEGSDVSYVARLAAALRKAC